jgi:acyl carrier protein
MTKQEKIYLIEEVLDVSANSLTDSSILDQINEYDSMAKLSLIVMCDDEFNKKLTGEQIREFKTIGDILNFLE